MSEGSGSAPALVVVVDDEEGLADLYALYLSNVYETRVAYDGETALDLIDGTVDVVLLDRRMPGLSGGDVLAELRCRRHDPFVAMLTAVDPGNDILELDVDEYVVKPVDRETVRGIVEALLARQDYDEHVQKFVATRSKQATLKTHLREHELASSEAYAELEREIRAAEEQFDPAVVERLASNDFDGFRDC